MAQILEPSGEFSGGFLGKNRDVLLEGRPSPGEFSGGIEGENKMLFCEEIPTEREKNGAAWGGMRGEMATKKDP